MIEWADRIVKLAMKTFPNLTDRQIYKQAIVRFWQGCLDKEAGHYALTARPTDMEDALNKVRWFLHTNRVMYGKSKKEIKEVRYSFDSSEEEDLVMKVSKASIKRQQENQKNVTQEKHSVGKNVTFLDPERTQHRLEKLETDTRDLKEQLSTLLDTVKDIQSTIVAKNILKGQDLRLSEMSVTIAEKRIISRKTVQTEKCQSGWRGRGFKLIGVGSGGLDLTGCSTKGLKSHESLTEGIFQESCNIYEPLHKTSEAEFPEEKEIRGKEEGKACDKDGRAKTEKEKGSQPEVDVQVKKRSFGPFG